MQSSSSPSHNVDVGSLQQILRTLETQRSRLAAIVLSNSYDSNDRDICPQSDVILQLFRVQQTTGEHDLVLEHPKHKGDTTTCLNGASDNSHRGEDPFSAKTFIGGIRQSDRATFEDIRSVRDSATSPSTDEIQPLYIGQTREGNKWVDEMVEKLRSANILIDASQATCEQALGGERALRMSKLIEREHIDLLSRYNAIKDVATGLIGMIAEARQERVIDIMRTYDVDADD